MNQANPTQDTSLNQVLAQLEKFGFKFFGYSESKDPLVIAPNGQVIPVSVAYNFVQTQISKANTGGNGVEGMPNMPSLPQMVNPETGIEKSPEKEVSIEKEKTPEINLPAIKTPTPANPPPKVSVDKSTGNSPYGDGFGISSFDPTDIDKTVNYVQKNSKASNTSTKKWLAIQLEKFLSEVQNRRK